MSTFGPYPEFGWSQSRSRALRECPRLLYWKAWGAHLGWGDDPSDAWLAYRLKHLTTVSAQTGVLVHQSARDVVQAVIRGEEIPEWQVLFDRCWSELQRLRTRSLEDFLRSPKRNPVLREAIYGGQEYLPDLYEAAREKLYDCIINLLESDALEEVSRCSPDQVLVTDALDAASITVAPGDEITVWAAPDLAYWSPDSQETLTILDWKSGRTDGAEEQIAAYALYLNRRFDIPLESTRLRGRAVGLDPYHDHVFDITSDQISAARARIRHDVDELRSYQADGTTNEPVARDLFQMLEEEERQKRCGWCSYAMLCDAHRPASRTEGPRELAGMLDLWMEGDL